MKSTGEFKLKIRFSKKLKWAYFNGYGLSKTVIVSA